MMFKSILLTALLLTSLISNSQAEHSDPNQMKFIQTVKTSNVEALQDPYFEVKTMKVRELTDEESRDFVDPTIPNLPPVTPIGGVGSDGGIGGVISTIDQLIATGQKLITLIRQGTPVVNNNPMASISVLPRTDAKDQVVHDMGGWSIPVSKHYQITFQNVLGMDVVSFTYSITYQYNGSIGGIGKYLAGVRASARDLVVSYGFDLDASSQLLQISNVGTSKNVIAGATLEMTYTVKNWARNLTTSTSYFVSGDGKFYELD